MKASTLFLASVGSQLATAFPANDAAGNNPVLEAILDKAKTNPQIQQGVAGLENAFKHPGAIPHLQKDRVDFSNWKPAGPGDMRAPCPCMNSLANHGIIPRDGKNLTQEILVEALSSALNLSPGLAAGLGRGAMLARKNKLHSQTFTLADIQEHDVIEHDASFSRQDTGIGNNTVFNQADYDQFMSFQKGLPVTNLPSLAKGKWLRTSTSKNADRKFHYKFKEFFLSYGEAGFLLSSLGDPVNGVVPTNYMNILFQEERWPYTEGWRPQETPITFQQIARLGAKLYSANPNKDEEARLIGLKNSTELLGILTKIGDVLHPVGVSDQPLDALASSPMLGLPGFESYPDHKESILEYIGGFIH